MAERQREKRTMASAIEVREAGSSVTLEGYASTFNDPYDLGPFREQVVPTAFRRTLGTGPDVRFLVDHEGQPLARTKSGTLELSTDSQGFHWRAKDLDNSDPDVQRLLPKVKRGDLDNCSFAFWVPPGGDEWSDNYTLRTLTNIEMNGGDVSVVTYPANPNTSVAMRGVDLLSARWILAERLLRDVREGKADMDALLDAIRGLDLRTITAEAAPPPELSAEVEAEEAESEAEIDEPEGMSLELAEALIKSVDK